MPINPKTYLQLVTNCGADGRPTSRQRGYTRRWEIESKAYLREYPLCVHCKAEGIDTLATLVDHIIPHRGNQVLFWDKTNWQPLCTRHHNRKTAAGE